MFTIKFYGEGNHRVVIKSAESLTILRGDDGSAEITLHQKNQNDDYRIDVAHDMKASYHEGYPPRYHRAIIENAAGKTTEMIVLGPHPMINVGCNSSGPQSIKAA